MTGAYALGPEAGEWMQQATLAIRARIPLDVLRDTIQPFPSFSDIYGAACGETTIVGLYRADSATELDGLLDALPLAAWMHVAVTPLEPHPNDPAAANGNRQ